MSQRMQEVDGAEVKRLEGGGDESSSWGDFAASDRLGRRKTEEYASFSTIQLYNNILRSWEMGKR